MDGESKGYRQVKCESKTHELELLVSNLMDPIGKANIVPANLLCYLTGGDRGKYCEQVQRKQLVVAMHYFL